MKAMFKSSSEYVSMCVMRISMAVTFLLFLPMVASAHHGEAAHYDLDSKVVVEAVLTDFKLVNPHGYVYFDVLSDAGKVENWRCELGTNLRRFGWTQDTLAPGGRVRVTGNPARREAHVCKINSIEHEDGRTIGFRGKPTEGTSTYKPSDTKLGFTPTKNPEVKVSAIATGTAATREIVDVPSEGFFGHWQATPAGVKNISGMRANRGGKPIKSDLPLPTAFMVPEYTATGAELTAKFDEGFDNAGLYCKSSVFDGMIHHGNTNEFVQLSDKSIRWVYGYMDLVREIHLDETEFPKDLKPSLMGHSNGRWDGDSLVVETKGFETQWLYNDTPKNPVISSEQLALTERVTHDVENDQLVIEYSMNDPLFWETPLSGVIRLSRSKRSYQAYDCVELAGDNNRRPDGTTIFD